MAMSRKFLLKNQRLIIANLIKTVMVKIICGYLMLIDSLFISDQTLNQPTLKITLAKHNFYKNKKRLLIHADQGFTLIELMVTTLVLAVIATMAAPTILTQLANMEAKRVKNTLMTTFSSAKAESYIRRQNILICLSNAGGRCHKESSQNLLLFIDKNDNKHFDSGTDQLLSEQHLDPKYGTLHLRAGRRHYVRFYGDSGKPRGHFGHIKYCPSKNYNKAMYQVSFNQVGIVKYKPNNIHDTGCAG